MNKASLILFVIGLILGLVVVLHTATGQYFTIIRGEAVEEDIPRKFTSDESIIYDALFLGVFSIAVESEKEISCSLTVLEGPMTNVTREGDLSGTVKDYSKYHLMAKISRCIN
jgi:hypothetical protein